MSSGALVVPFKLWALIVEREKEKKEKKEMEKKETGRTMSQEAISLEVKRLAEEQLVLGEKVRSLASLVPDAFEALKRIDTLTLKVEELRKRRRTQIKRRNEVEAALLSERKKNFEMRKDLDLLRRENDQLREHNKELHEELYWAKSGGKEKSCGRKN